MTPIQLARRKTRTRRRPSSAKPLTNFLLPVLVVDDSRFTSNLVQRAIEEELGCPTVVAHSKEEALEALQDTDVPFFAAVCDMNLPDAPHGELVDDLLKERVPTVVLTASYSEETRDQILGKGVVDYYLKDSRSVELLSRTLGRLIENPKKKILIVDDSALCRKRLLKLLAAHYFSVLACSDAQHGLELLESNPDITLVIVDYMMPDMKGIEFVSKARKQRGSDQLAILGSSASDVPTLSAKFLKSGADDFIPKPFLDEEFYCRVYRSLDTLSHIEAVRRMAYYDQLTGLQNRRSFFENMMSQYRAAKETEVPFWVAMLDIDHFKSINDTYSHAGGDEALKAFARIATDTINERFLARMGGEEFCIVGFDSTLCEAREELEKLRSAVESNLIRFEGREIRFTLSGGVTDQFEGCLDDMIHRADEVLYRAKETGRNRILCG